MNTKRWRNRAIILALVLLAILVFYIVRLGQLQIVEGESYLAIANQGSVVTQAVPAARGEIVDRYGRPFTQNRAGLDVTIDLLYTTKSELNGVISQLIAIMQQENAEWIDNLPITTTEPFSFTEDAEDAVTRLKSFLNMQSFASADDAMHWLVDLYDLEDYTATEARLIAAVRYEMDQQEFSVSNPYTFAKDISTELAAKIKEISYQLPGVTITESPVREYVDPTSAPHIIGLTGPITDYEKYKDLGYSLNDTVGQSGIELLYEEYLRGTAGSRKTLLNSSGDVIKVIDEVSAIPGDTVVLTLDKQLQMDTYQALENQILKQQQNNREGQGKEANAGAAVVINVKTGEILALVSYPSYNLATFRQDYEDVILTDPAKPLNNRALMAYVPGSIFKPSVAVGALQEGIVSPTDLINCVNTYTFFEDYQPSCMYYHGEIDIKEAISVSCNYYFFEVGRLLGIDKLTQYVKQFGLGEPTGIELPESTGQVASPETKEALNQTWFPGDILQAAIGQSDNQFTPLQLACYAATIANKGTRMKATIVKSIMDSSLGNEIYTHTPTVLSTVDADPSVFDTVIEGMVMTSRTGSSSHVFANYPIDVASKTGSPQAGNDINATFIAFAPADDPEIAIAIVIEKGYSGTNCAYVAKDIFDSYFLQETTVRELDNYNTILQ